MSNIPKSKRKPTQFQYYKAVKQIDNLFFQLFNLKYEDLRKWQKQQTKAIRMISQKS